MANQTRSQEVANAILSQLGGRAFVAMTGAKHLFSQTFQGGRDGLSFKLPRAKDGINYVTIALEADDTYTVTFSRVFRAGGNRERACVQMVHADSLRAVFEAHTGLYTSLGTMRGAR